MNQSSESQSSHQPEARPDEEGQVSEVASLEDPAEAISPEDSVAGAPEGESGRADEGPTGPDAPTNDPRQDRHPDKGDVETTG